MLNKLNPGDKARQVDEKCPLCGSGLYVIDESGGFSRDLTDGHLEYCENESEHLFEVGRLGRTQIIRNK